MQPPTQLHNNDCVVAHRGREADPRLHQEELLDLNVFAPPEYGPMTGWV